ncbi:hypothetical protein Mal4_02840 [Maioricimonas rarisocia]|uniref:Uncharacterized protein n=1 Tax=Maioricimonas rarisocia TaxID=2528026 RepID=A0A517Z0I3_9PLAN|nr:hypothetical protein [Maioricimonas rarisocia]QDU36001.1 hypothetical protein Mal4_02840 [Maioricimonas rarisocia]
MFSSLWRREEPCRESTPDERTVTRTDAAALRFRGDLQLESNGTVYPDYVDGDPYHRICVYAVTDGGYAVTIEFHHDDTCTIDGELVGTVGELDDFLCLHAADHFPQMPTGTDSASAERERRVLTGYDRQVVDILRSLGGNPLPPPPEAGKQDAPKVRKAKGTGKAPLDLGSVGEAGLG